MLIDGYGRRIDYLRLSVTQRCNFRCTYCMPTTPFTWVPKENILSFEELFCFVRVAIDEGIRKIRITGGEPTLREGLDSFLRMIFTYKPDIDLAMTTNGFLLPALARSYADAGLKRVNISLDSLKPDTAAKIAGGKEVLSHVLAGIDAALDAGLRVKLNCVPMRGINDMEIVDLIEYARHKGVMIRFIEFMENTHAKTGVHGLQSSEILDLIRSRFASREVVKEFNSPAKLYQCDDGYIFGIIEPHKEDFCDSCNRVRLSAEGFLIPCLYFDDAITIKEAIRAGDTAAALSIFRDVICNKPEKNKWSGVDFESSDRAFYVTGG